MKHQPRLRSCWPLLLSVLIVHVSSGQAEKIILSTKSGKLRGFTQDVDGTKVNTFLGVPFAEPPTGPMRFKAPSPVTPWQGVKDALTLPNSCMQTVDESFARFKGVEMWNPNTNISEDCLYLNLWVPKPLTNAALTTIVWIYGGNFVSGTSTLDVYDGRYLAAKQAVIVASMQYRLGAFGFLYSGTEEAPGNMGFLDQQMALRWIHDNIEAFNGDKTGITLMGESAGSASVNHHLLSASSWPLFDNAIMLSSSSYAAYSWEPAGHQLDQFYRFAKLMDCDDDDTEEILECLRDADADTLQAMQWHLDSTNVAPIGPVIDGNFLTDTPEKLVAAGHVKNTSIIMGNTKDEGEYFLVYRFQDVFKPEDLWNPKPLTRPEYVDIARRIGNWKAGLELESILYTYEYSVLPHNRSTYRDILDDILGDVLFKCPIHDFAEGVSSQEPAKGRVYMYSYDYRHSANPWPARMGALHGYEIEMVFGLPYNRRLNYSSQDLRVSQQMMDYFVAFATHGSPNTRRGTTYWPEYKSDREKKYIVFNGGPAVVKEGYRHKECSFWNKLFPKIREVEESRAVSGTEMLGSTMTVTFLCILNTLAVFILGKVQLCEEYCLQYDSILQK